MESGGLTSLVWQKDIWPHCTTGNVAYRVTSRRVRCNKTNPEHVAASCVRDRRIYNTGFTDPHASLRHPRPSHRRDHTHVRMQLVSCLGPSRTSCGKAPCEAVLQPSCGPWPRTKPDASVRPLIPQFPGLLPRPWNVLGTLGHCILRPTTPVALSRPMPLDLKAIPRPLPMRTTQLQRRARTRDKVQSPGPSPTA